MNISSDFKKGLPWMVVEVETDNTLIREDIHKSEIEDLFYSINSLAQDLFMKMMEFNNERRQDI